MRPGIADLRAFLLAFEDALCGYEGETHHELEARGWSAIAWKAGGGFGNQVAESRGRDNATRERIWFSPACIQAERGLFD